LRRLLFSVGIITLARPARSGKCASKN